MLHYSSIIFTQNILQPPKSKKKEDKKPCALAKVCITQADIPCPPVEELCIEITQADLPYVITVPGIYCVKTDLVYRGTGSAITINNVKNVKLRFFASSLTLINPAATGVKVINGKEVVIEGDAIENAAVNSTGFGISITQSNFVTLNNLLLRKHFQGIRISDSTKVTVNNSSIEQSNNTGAFVELSENVTCNDVTFRDNTIGLHFSGLPALPTSSNADCKVNECSFYNSTGLAELDAQQIAGLVIQGCTFKTASVTGSVIRFGETVGGITNADLITLQDSTVIYEGAAAPPGGAITFLQSIKSIVDSVNVIALNGVIIDGDVGGTANTRELIIRNSTLTTTNGGNGLLFGANTSELLIDACVISARDNAVNFTNNALGCMISNCSLWRDLRIDATNCKVVNNVFTRFLGQATLIEVVAGSAFCDIQNNTVTNITIDDSDNNYIRNNHVRGTILLSNTANQNAVYENYAPLITLNAGTTNNYVVNNFVDTLSPAVPAGGNIQSPNFVLNP